MHAPSTFIMYISVYGGKLTWCLSETVRRVLYLNIALLNLSALILFRTWCSLQNSFCHFLLDTTSDSIVNIMKKFSLSPSNRLSNLATVFLEVSVLYRYYVTLDVSVTSLPPTGCTSSVFVSLNINVNIFETSWWQAMSPYYFWCQFHNNITNPAL